MKPTRTKEGREIIPFMVESYLTHNFSNVTYMQMVRSNSNMRSRTSISRQCNFPFYSKSSSTLKSNINMLHEKLNAKRQRQMTSQLFIIEKTITLPNKTIHITLRSILQTNKGIGAPETTPKVVRQWNN